MGKSFVTIKYKINSTARITIEVSEKVKEVIEQTDRTVHISYDLVGILPELNNPLHEEMALLLRYAILRSNIVLLKTVKSPFFIISIFNQFQPLQKSL